MQYVILDGSGKRVGYASVEPAGMYWQIRCFCDLPADKRWHIHVRNGDGNTDLGLCTPRDGGVGLYTCQPAKHIGEGKLQWLAVAADHVPAQDFVPVDRDKPCPCISRLRVGKLAVCKGKQGIVFTK